jgi:hypothetical protein
MKHRWLLLSTLGLCLGFTPAAAHKKTVYVVEQQPVVVVEQQPVYVTQAAPAEVIVEEAPPAERVEVITASPGDGYFWIKGHWKWDGRYIWESGHWELRPRPAAVWIAGHWEKRHHWHWIPGHWE